MWRILTVSVRTGPVIRCFTTAWVLLAALAVFCGQVRADQSGTEGADEAASGAGRQVAAASASATEGQAEPAQPEPAGSVQHRAYELPREVRTGPGARWLGGKFLTGNWGGLRDRLSEKGMEIGLSYTHVWQVNARGGVCTRNGQRHSGSWDLTFSLDTEKAGLWKGGLFWLYAEGYFGEGISPKKVGDYFGVNGDAGGEYVLLLAEYWYEQTLFDGTLRVRLGKMDATGDFDTNAYANDEVSQFLNNALVNNPQIPFPEYALGVQMVWTPVEWFYAAAGTFDAEADARTTGFNTAMHGPDHFFLVGEVGFTPKFKLGDKPLWGTYRVGCWYDPTPKEVFIDDLDGRRLPPVETGDWGLYLNFDQLIFKENADEDDAQGLGVFFRYGHARGSVNEVENFYSWGLSYQGLLPGRDDDVFAVGFAYADFSDDMKVVEPGIQREAVIETYYHIHVADWLHITPDLQWIIDPGGQADARDSFVVGLRIVIDL